MTSNSDSFVGEHTQPFLCHTPVPPPLKPTPKSSPESSVARQASFPLWKLAPASFPFSLYHGPFSFLNLPRGHLLIYIHLSAHNKKYIEV